MRRPTPRNPHLLIQPAMSIYGTCIKNEHYMVSNKTGGRRGETSTTCSTQCKKRKNASNITTASLAPCTASPSPDHVITSIAWSQRTAFLDSFANAHPARNETFLCSAHCWTRSSVEFSDWPTIYRLLVCKHHFAPLHLLHVYLALLLTSLQFWQKNKQNCPHRRAGNTTATQQNVPESWRRSSLIRHECKFRTSATSWSKLLLAACHAACMKLLRSRLRVQNSIDCITRSLIVCVHTSYACKCTVHTKNEHLGRWPEIRSIGKPWTENFFLPGLNYYISYYW